MSELQGEFAGVLRDMRARARLTQQALADAAGVGLRTVSDLERGASAMPQRETVRLLADALGLLGLERERFEAAARGARPMAVPAAAAATRSLPRDVTSFTGRERELQQLAADAAIAGGVVGIHAIGGMAGVGKTAFAVHAAHQLAGRFPGGQVFLSLHGHTPGRAPVDPADALASLLLAIGVPAAQIPSGVEARTALWRDRVSGTPLLLILDDAASSDQVSPLLPGAGGSLVLVTSRRHLSALDDATAMSLDTLPADQAAELLVRLAGRPGLAAGDPGVRDLARLCGFLPLALGMVARQLRHHPAWSAAARAAELGSARDRLGLLETENLSVAAAFDLSYANLSPPAQLLFRRLGLHLGEDIDAYAAAALDCVDLGAARRGLESLYDHYLLAEPAHGRYRLHDLLREHARALAGRLDPEADRGAATTRLLDYYEHTAARADAHVTRRTRPRPAVGPGAPAEAPALPGNEQALAWIKAERANVMACLDHAADTGQHARVTALTGALNGLFIIEGPWVDAIARGRAAVQCARLLGDRLREANALNDLGEVLRVANDHRAAIEVQEDALGIYRELGDRLGEANAIYCIGASRYITSDFEAAMESLQNVVDLYRELADRRGQANALTFLGGAFYQLADYPAALRILEDALEICRDLGDLLGEGNAWAFLGDVRQLTGDYPGAVRGYKQALRLYGDLGRPIGQANCLAYLGRIWQKTGDYPAATQALGEALHIYREYGDRRGIGNALNFLGTVRRAVGDYPAASEALAEALAEYREIGDRQAAAEVLNEQGTVHRLGGALGLARDCHQQALELARDISAELDEALALAGLGRCALAEGDAAAAASLLGSALEILERAGAGEASAVRAEVETLAGPRAR